MNIIRVFFFSKSGSFFEKREEETSPLSPLSSYAPVHTLRGTRKCLTVETAKILDNAFIDSQFNYAPLIWMFCKKTPYLKTEKIHHKTFRIINQSNTSYCNLLECNDSASINQRHLQFLLTEIYKGTVTKNPRFK